METFGLPPLPETTLLFKDLATEYAHEICARAFPYRLSRTAKLPWFLVQKSSDHETRPAPNPRYYLKEMTVSSHPWEIVGLGPELSLASVEGINYHGKPYNLLVATFNPLTGDFMIQHINANSNRPTAQVRYENLAGDTANKPPNRLTIIEPTEFGLVKWVYTADAPKTQGIHDFVG